MINKVKFTLFFHRNVSAATTEISAKEGVVTLRGEASSQAQKELTTEYARDVDGVKDVKNEMTVAKSRAKKRWAKRSTPLTNRSMTCPSPPWSKRHCCIIAPPAPSKTTVKTKDGVVTLGGTARTAAEKTLAAKLVSDVHGVKKVVNDMTVE